MKNENTLVLHLKDTYFTLIEQGKKKVEYREYKPFWISRIKDQKKIVFIRGYKNNNGNKIEGKIKRIDLVTYQELPSHAKKEFKDSDYDEFFAISFELITGEK